DYVTEVQVADVWENYVTRKFEDEKTRRESAGTALPYPPDMTTKWLGWVARLLQVHTQDQHRFFVEELQPTWLSRGGLILSYVLTFAVLLAVAYLLTQFALRAGLPIIYGQEGVQQYLGDYLKISIPLGSLWIVLLVWVFARRCPSYFAPIAIGVLSGIVFGTMIWIPYRGMPGLALIGGVITGVIAVALVRTLIKILGCSEKQIVCVKRRKRYWTKAASGLVVGIVFVLLIALISDISRAMFFEGTRLWPALQRAFSFDTVVWWNWELPGLLSVSMFFLLVLGLSWGQVDLRDEVDVPNQGIIDSGRNGLIVAAGGVVAGLIFSLAIGLPCYFGIGFKASTGSCVSGELSSLLSGLHLGLGLGAILGLIFGLILGGFAWIRHYLVRSLLVLDHQQIPWQLERFLTYATQLNLLRRVGGGFEFIDQELQAYFERADASRPPPESDLAGRPGMAIAPPSGEPAG
ncbi:MAG: hypothetical protein ACK2U9_20235, partial [Anaerolineae bacterium]